MASWIEAIISPLKTAGELAQGLIEVRDTVKFGDAVIKLQAQIMAAHQGAFAAQALQTAMAEEVRALKEKVARFETWDAEKSRYQLQKIPPSAFVYALKENEARGEPMHYLCQRCYHDGKKSILQSRGLHNGLERFHCNSCSAEIVAGSFRAPTVQR
jgi:hypothetical protein